MKLFKYMAAAAASLLLASCTLDLPKTTLAPDGDMVAPVLSPMTNIISDANTSKEQVTFTWTPADFGANTQIVYYVWAKLGEEEGIIGTSYDNKLTLSKGDLVGVICSDLGGAKNEHVTIESYVMATVYGTTEVEMVKSNVITYSVYTYLPPKKNIWLPGKYQGWAQFGTMVWEAEAGTNQYKILVDVSNPDETPYYFKIVDESGSWVGMNDGYTADGWSVADPSNSDGNFSVTADEPILWLTINTKKKTVAKTVISKVAMIGAFNGWDEANEAVFTYNATDNVWVSPVIAFTGEGGWLVRLNKSWDYKFGSAVATTDIEGGYEVTQGGSDIPSPEAGNYIVKLYANRTPFVIVYEKQ
ncbi:MAG: SusE domain-containing protein [Candidatus Cryptobacteroides sp.]